MMQINLFIESDFPTLKPGDTVFDAMELMETEKVRQAILVYEDNRVVILDEEDILNYNDTLPVESIVPRFVDHYLFEGDHPYKAMEFMAKNKIEVCPVFGESESYIGVLKSSTIFNQLIEKEFEGSGALITLKVNLLDYSLSDISRIIESEGLKVKQLRPLGGDAESLYFVLRLNKVDARAAVGSLRRYGYQVEQINGDAEDVSIDKDRYGLLMKYLEI